MEDAGKDRGWRWRTSDRPLNEKLGLLYEPGNWGDILKGSWAVLAARAAIRIGRRTPFRYLDPFAGAPTYPLVPASSRRLESQPLEWFRRLQDPYRSQGLLASTARLVLDAARAGGVEARLAVYDLDPARQEAWRREDDARVLAVEAGEEALEAAAAGRMEQDLILIDPHDLFDRWKDRIEPAIRAARACPVLLYLYNRAPRGGGHERAYRDIRRALEGEAGRILVGRVPSDAVLPRAYHEVILLAPEPSITALEAELESTTRTLACWIAGEGCFEG